jgi:hypothetical protein
LKLYCIKDWGTIYETAETRKLENLRWVPVPNKHDGLGFRRVAGQKNAAELFCAWNLIIQIASKGRKSDRGQLIRDGKPLSAADMALMTGFSKSMFEKALAFFSDPSQGWLILADNPERAGESAGEAGINPERAGLSPAEGKGREGKEGKEGPPLPSQEKDPTIPSVQEVIQHGQMGKGIPPEYCREYHAKCTEQNRWVKNGKLIRWGMEIDRWWDGDRHKWQPKGKPLAGEKPKSIHDTRLEDSL